MGALWRIVLDWAAIACIGAGICLAPDAASASPWNRDPGDFLIITQAEFFKAKLDPIETPQGPLDGLYERIESQTYLEAGLTRNVMVGGKTRYGTSWLRRGPDQAVGNGFSEVELFAQYQILRNDRHALAIKLAGVLPGGVNSGQRPELQSDGFDLDLRLGYGRNITQRPVKVFSTVEAGYRKRLGDAADQAVYQTTLGVEPSKRFLILLDSYGAISMGNNKDNGADYDIIKVKASLVWRMSKRWRLQGGVMQEVYGRDVDIGRAYFIGFWTHF